MTPRKEALFALALEKPAERRSTSLDTLGAGDPAFRQRRDQIAAE